MNNWKPYAILAVIIAIFVGGLYLYAKSGEPVGADFSSAIEVMPTRDHIIEGSPRPEYNSNPPTSGNHYDKPSREAFFDQPIVDEHMVHNLEHGDIWVSYRASTTPASVVQQLKGLSHPKLVITPRPENPNDICLAAWGRLDCFDLEGNPLDETRIHDFIERYKYKGPEQIDPAFQVNFN